MKNLVIIPLGLVLGMLATTIIQSWINLVPAFPTVSSVVLKVVQLYVAQLILFGHMLMVCGAFLFLTSRIPLLNPFTEWVQQDYSVFSFLLFWSFPPFFLPFSFGDYQSTGPFFLTCLLVLVVGGLVAMLLPEPGTRLLALLGTTALTSLVISVGIYKLYPLQVWAAQTSFPRWWETLVPLISGLVIGSILSVSILVRRWSSKATW